MVKKVKIKKLSIWTCNNDITFVYKRLKKIFAQVQMNMVFHSLGHRKMVIKALNDQKIIHCLPFHYFTFRVIHIHFICFMKHLQCYIFWTFELAKLTSLERPFKWNPSVLLLLRTIWCTFVSWVLFTFYLHYFIWNLSYPEHSEFDLLAKFGCYKEVS